MNKTTAGVCCLLLAASLAGCGSTPQTSAVPEREIVTAAEAPTEKFTDIPLETDPEADELVYDADNIKVTYKGLQKTKATFYIENNSEKYLSIKPDNITSNNIQLGEDNGYLLIEPHSGHLSTIFFNYTKMQEAGIAQISEFSFNLKYSFNDTMYELQGAEETVTELFTFRG
jgi:hypothetical protein